MLPGYRPHAPQHVADLLRGIVEKFRDHLDGAQRGDHGGDDAKIDHEPADPLGRGKAPPLPLEGGAQALNAFFTCTVRDRKSTRLNSSHRCISYAVFCLKKKNKTHHSITQTTRLT